MDVERYNLWGRLSKRYQYHSTKIHKISGLDFEEPDGDYLR